jgi:hypothetical protein
MGLCSVSPAGGNRRHRAHPEGNPMSFETWIAEIEAVVTFDVDAELWRKYFDAGLTPLQAIEQNRIDEEV